MTDRNAWQVRAVSAVRSGPSLPLRRGRSQIPQRCKYSSRPLMRSQFVFRPGRRSRTVEAISGRMSVPDHPNVENGALSVASPLLAITRRVADRNSGLMPSGP
jgi:hypothetical protein